MSTGAGLRQAVRDDPDDRTVRLVYADWLDEQNDPLGAYVRAEAEAAAHSPGGGEWDAAVRRLLASSSQAEDNFGGWEYTSDLARLREKIDRLRAIDVEMQVPGARWGTSGHEYHLNPPPRERDLLEWELRHGLLLPAEYRAFLLRVGNGRVGPEYGLYPLDLARDYPALRKPFGVTPAKADSIAAARRAARASRNWRDVPKFQEAWYERGYHHLVDIGSGNSSVLVMNGPLRGEIWAEGVWFVPHRDAGGRPKGFFAWYEDWLDRWLTPGAIEEWARLTGQ